MLQKHNLTPTPHPPTHPDSPHSFPGALQQLQQRDHPEGTEILVNGGVESVAV